MSSPWKSTNLGKIADIKRGLPSQDLNYVENNTEGVRLIRINDFKSYSPKYIKETQRTSQLTVRKGDILIAGTGATAGISFLVNDLWDGLPFSYNAPRIRVKNENCSVFIYYILNSEKIKSQQNKLFTGNAQPFLDTRAIGSFKIPLPPLPEQQKIAEILSTVDEKIDLIDQKIKETEELKKGMMQRLLTKGIGHTKFKDSPLGKIPESWEVVSTESIGEITSSKRIHKADYTENGIPFYRGKEITQLAKGRSLDDVVYIKTETFENLKEKFGAPEAGDILITAVGTIGSVYLVKKSDEFYFKDGNLMWLRKLTKKIDKRFLMHYLRSIIFQNMIDVASGGSSQKALTIVKFKKLFVPIPTAIEQTKIVEVLDSIYAKHRVLIEKKAYYNDLKQGLMQKLLTGKIRVNNLIKSEVTA